MFTFDNAAQRYVWPYHLLPKGLALPLATKRGTPAWDIDPLTNAFYTLDPRAAVQLREHADARAERELDRTFLSRSPWLGPLPHPPGEKLLPFQPAAIRFALERNRSYLALEIGLGKSICAAVINNAVGGLCLYVCPPYLVLNVADELRRWRAGPLRISTSLTMHPRQFPAVWVVPDSRVHTKELRAEVAQWLRANPKAPTLLIVDECFPAGTLVDTPEGPRPIEEIRPGDKVLNCLGTDRVTATSIVFKDRALSIETERGEIICSENHVFLTAAGWKPACDLEVGHEIVETQKAMHAMRQGVSGASRSGNMQQNMQVPSGIKSALRDTPAWFSGKYAAKQSNVPEPYPCQSQQDTPTNRARPQNPWWKRHRPDHVRGPSFFSAREKLGAEFRDTYKITQLGLGLPDLLQSRFSLPIFENSCGVRRVVPPSVSSSSPRSEKGRILKITRLDSPALQKRGYSRENGGYRFYDLTISGHPSFSVIGLVAHNCQRYSHLSARRTRALFQALVRSFRKVVFLSGTPMSSRPMDLWPVLSECAPETIDFMTEEQYGLKYCGGRYVEGKGWDFKHASNVEELASRIKGPFMLRLWKKDVLPDLPPIVEELVVIGDELPPAVLEMEAAILRHHSPEDLVGYRLKTDSGLAEDEEIPISTYRRLLAMIKARAALSYIRGVLEDTEAPLIVYGYHKEAIEFLRGGLADYSPVVITGQTPVSKRHDMVKTFQAEDGPRVLLANYLTMVGHNITRPSLGILAEFSWVPAENDQALGRMHREGQRSTVLGRYLVFRDSLDRRIIEVIIKKRRYTQHV